MSKHPSFPLHAWGGEPSTLTRNPSWMARRAVSTRPPVPAPSAPLAPSELHEHQEPGGPSGRELPESASPPLVPATAQVDLSSSIALAQLADENAALRGQVAEMASMMARLRRQVLEASEGELVKLALAVAERVVGREIATDPKLVVEWAHEAIEALAAKDEVVIAIAKDVAQATPIEAWAAVGVDHKVQVDGQLAPGSIDVHAAEGVVASSADARLGAVARSLGIGSP
jgi:flagellar assembly protein FliH